MFVVWVDAVGALLNRPAAELSEHVERVDGLVVVFEVACLQRRRDPLLFVAESDLDACS